MKHQLFLTLQTSEMEEPDSPASRDSDLHAFLEASDDESPMVLSDDETSPQQPAPVSCETETSLDDVATYIDEAACSYV